MKIHIKTIYGTVILGVCLLVAILFISQITKQLDSITLLVQPSAQLAAVTPVATLTLSPSTSSVPVGSTLTVSILLNTGGQLAYGVDVNRLHFNPNVLRVVDADSVTAGVQIALGSLMSMTIINSVDNVGGTIQFSQVPWDQVNGKPTAFNGSGVLATVTFQVIAVGTSNISFDFTLGSSIDCNVAGSGADLLSSASGGSYTGTAGNVVDTTAPVISAVSASSITQNGATIKWTTDDSANSQVLYGLSSAYGSNTTVNSSMVTSPHTVTLPGTGLPALTPNTVYHYKVRSTNSASLTTESGDYTFTTLAPVDNTPPTISNTIISGVTTSSATITWTTSNENSDTQVEYALTSLYTNSISTPLKDSPNAVPASSRVTFPHTVTLSGLSAGTPYHYKVKSRDAAGNLAVSLDNVFTTDTLADTTKPLAPGGLTAISTNENQIQLSWTASTDSVGVGQSVSGIAGYNVYRGGILLNTSALITTTAYLDVGLTPGATYGYQIEAVDKASPANISVKSSIVSATTPLLSKNVQRNIILTLEGALSTQRNVSGTVEFLNPVDGSKIHEANIVTNTTGQVLVIVPSGLLPKVTIRPKILGYLSKLITNVDLRDTTVLNVNFPTLPAGDFNGDQRINSLDFSYMNARWGKADLLADIDKNGVVNTLDFSFLSNNWLLAGE